ncbi:MAG TPA: RHS repeat-associated core domain-containing protein, partial [Prosthecobacter sp.]|nr:RHS repeat-associated core domain-containing protein [Prosthecobacter sp.]
MKPLPHHILARGRCEGGLDGFAVPTLYRHWHQRFIAGVMITQILLANLFNPQLGHAAPVYTEVAGSYAYDGNGNITSRTDANGLTTSITYDALNRITAVDYPGGGTPDVALAYDVNGNLVRMTDATGTTLYEYDLFDRLVEIARPDGGFVIYDYDNVGNVIGLRYGNYLALQADGTQTYVQYGYDADNRMISAKNAGTGHVTTYGYNAAGHITRRTLPNGVYTDYGYDADGRLVSTVHRKPDGTLICGYQDTLDTLGNRTQVVESIPEGTRTTSYTYDALGRLDTVSYPTGRGVDYDYDTWGNRIRMAETTGGVTHVRQYTYDTDARLLSTTWDGAAEESFYYDKNGNLVQRHRIADNRVTSLIYDAEDRLIRRYDGVNNVSYEYNGIGERVAKVVNGVRTHFVNDPNRPHTQVLTETNAAGTPTRVYEWGNELINQEDATGGSRHYHLQDGPLGNVRRVVASDATVVNSYEFDAFGAPMNKMEGVANDFQFHGEMQEEETGLLFLRARFADPETGRFLSRDPKAGSLRMPATLNRYVFVLNNPVNLTDPDGAFPMPPAYPEARKFSVPTPPRPNMSRYDHVDHKASVTLDPEVSVSASYRGVGPRVSYSWDGLKYSMVAEYKNVEFSTSDGLSLFDLEYASQDGYSGFKWTPTIGLGLKNKALEKAGLGLGVAGSAGYFTYLQKRTWHSALDGAGVDKNLVEEVLGREGLSSADLTFAGKKPPGGVALDKSAKVLLDINRISGAAFDSQTGQIILYGKEENSATALPKMDLDDLAVAFKAAAMGNMPVLSIEDPVVANVPEWPGRECFTVRYGPFYTDPLDGQKKVLNLTSKTRFGWVMFEADRLMKVLLMGKDNRYPEIPASSNVPGYMNGMELNRLYAPDVQISTESRFWLNPKEIVIAPSADGKAMELARATMQVSTETMYASNGQMESLPEAEYFANWFTQNYDAIAEEQVTLDPEDAPRRALKELKQLA